MGVRALVQCPRAVTNTSASAGRLNWENVGRNPTQSAAWKTTEISLPVAITLFPEDVYRPPETWARRAYEDLIYFHEVDRGGVQSGSLAVSRSARCYSLGRLA